jgi:hypothetical protein
MSRFIRLEGKVVPSLLSPSYRCGERESANGTNSLAVVTVFFCHLGGHIRLLPPIDLLSIIRLNYPLLYNYLE